MADIAERGNMGKTINVAIKDKIARTIRGNGSEYICGNSDFVVVFDFDEEWDALGAKTARFKYNGTHEDVVFSGNQVNIPIIENTHMIKVGVFAGNLHTTTPAVIMARKSILCGSSAPAAPSPDVYSQLLDKINSGMLKGEKGEKGDPGVAGADGKDGQDGLNGKDGQDGKDGVNGKDGYTPQKGIDYFDGADGEDGYTPVKGVDYWTDADKEEIIAEVISREEINKIQQDIDDLRSDMNYVAIDITSISNNIGTVEKGVSVTEMTVTWKLNKEPTKQTLGGEDVAVSERSKTVSMDGRTSVSLTVTDERDATDSASTGYNAYNGVYYGAAAYPEAIDSAFVLGLAKKTLTSTKARTVTVTAEDGQHIWYAVPVELGKCSFSVGGFSGGFDLVDTIEFTNASGYAEPYYVYASSKTGLGETKVVIS